ncbi:Fur family transcriptional regulator [Roseibium sp. RKSG952]|uniref:Fur family transcriptional regulator n=1 Tax=Roseibium sp. RKSG952 TaxID=2529384 RepID=UPI0012BC28FC|nr:Fur family transcriptional regulator [Roseibium sp. RKSG952]MTH96601.1 transcriptional repressor [Roseibium sp. RKSG952]
MLKDRDFSYDQSGTGAIDCHTAHARVSRSDKSKSPSVDVFFERLAECGLRVTKQRRAVALRLCRSGHRHVDAATLFEEMSGSETSVSLATIYNILHDFEQAGLLRRIAVPGERVWFDTDTGDHNHFFFTGEGRLMDIQSEETLVRMLPAPPEGYRIARVDMVLHLVAEPET